MAIQDRSGRYRVLVVEDDPSDALLVRVMVGESLPSGTILMARRLGEAVSLVDEHDFDVVLLDLTLPDSFGLDTVRAMRRHAPSLPLIVLTGHGDTDLGLLAIADGAQDFIVKQDMDPAALSRSIRFAVQRAVNNRRDGTQAHLDPATGLPTGDVLEQVLERALARSARSGTSVAVIRLDLTETTDSVAAGDATVLRSAADRLTGRLRDGDTIGHLGGGRFLGVIEGLDADGLDDVAERLLDGCRRPFETEGRTVTAAPVVGIAVATDLHDVAGLLAAAERAREAAMYAPSRCHFADPDTNAAVHQRREDVVCLRRATQREQFVLHYQPIVEMATGRVAALEALLRWQHPDRGMVGPHEFLTMAARDGLMVGIGHWAIARALRDLRSFHDAGHRIGVAVNLSAGELCAGGLVETVRSALAQNRMEGRWLDVELTEDMLAEPERTRAVLLALKDLGAHCSIDDFGTGYSSLAYLADLPVDAIKIDRSFIARASEENQSTAIIRATIAMAHELGLAVVAEGVETDEQLAALQAQGCDYAQGFLIGAPVPADECARWLASADPAPAQRRTPS